MFIGIAMIYTRAIEYAMRALVQLANQKPGRSPRSAAGLALPGRRVGGKFLIFGRRQA